MNPAHSEVKAAKHPIVAIRRAGVPLVAFETSDPAQTIVQTTKALNGNANKVPLLSWDICRGLSGLNTLGVNVVSAILERILKPMGADLALLKDPTAVLDVLRQAAQENKVASGVCGDPLAKMLDSGIFFFQNGHLFTKSETVVQALWNLRDTLKPTAATLVVLCPALSVPTELSHDIVVITEPLPNAAEVSIIVDGVCKDAGLTTVSDKDKVVDTLLGMSAFAIEQVLAMSIEQGEDGTVVLNRDELWDRKRKMVEQTPGLSVFRGDDSFSDVGGLENIKFFLNRILNSGNNPVRCIGFIDEIEKMFGANTGGDLSGVSQDQLKVFLTEMQDSNIPGLILIGPPGTGKSIIAKGAGAVADAEVLTIDTGAMTGSLVGQSQGMIRHAMATFKAVSQGKGLFIATCNQISALPPELRRRFTLGTFFVDLPSAVERKAIWALKLKEYAAKSGSSLTLKSELPSDEGWTGAEIRACCDVAYRSNIGLKEAAEFIVPVSIAAAAQIDALRKMASDKFISANTKGIYHYDPTAVPAPLPDTPSRPTRRFSNEKGGAN